MMLSCALADNASLQDPASGRAAVRLHEKIRIPEHAEREHRHGELGAARGQLLRRRALPGGGLPHLVVLLSEMGLEGHVALAAVW